MLNKIESLQLENPKQKAVIYFALAKTFDDQKKYDQASEFLKMANDQMNLIIDKNVMLKISRKYNNIKHIFENFINFRSFNHDELYNKKLIFVVGMPRWAQHLYINCLQLLKVPRVSERVLSY